MSRGWTEIPHPNWQDEDYYDKVKPELDELAKEWSRIHDTAERRGFERAFELEDHWGGDYDFEPGELEMFQAQRRTRDMLEQAQLEAIEKRMEELGARMMRPYEHWNEDERYMQYMENRGY